jgi:hypothetical protein
MACRLWNARSDGLRDQGVHVGRTLGGAVELEMQRRHRVDVQALEQAVAQEAGGLVQRFGGLFRVAREQAEEHLGVRVVGRHLDGLDRHHAHPRVLQLARDQLRQIALDLVGNLEAAVGGGGFSYAWHGLSTASNAYSVRAISLISKNSSCRLP